MKDLELNIESYIAILFEFIVDYGMKIIGAVIVLVFGLWLIKVLNSSRGYSEKCVIKDIY